MVLQEQGALQTEAAAGLLEKVSVRSVVGGARRAGRGEDWGRGQAGCGVFFWVWGAMVGGDRPGGVGGLRRSCGAGFKHQP